MSLPSSTPGAGYEDIQATPIEAIGLSVRAYKGFWKLGIRTLGDAPRVSAEELMANRCIGPLSLQEIREALGRLGLALRGDPAPVRSEADTTAESLGSDVFTWFSRFAGEPAAHMGMPVWVLDFCPRLLAWLTRRQIRTVRDLVGNTADDLWLLALAEDLPLDEALNYLDEVSVRLASFGLSLRSSFPLRKEFHLPAGRPEQLADYRLDEFRLRAETVLRLRSAGVRTLGDLRVRAAALEEELATWPPETRAQTRALLALLGEAAGRSPRVATGPAETKPAESLPAASLVT